MHKLGSRDHTHIPALGFKSCVVVNKGFVIDGFSSLSRLVVTGAELIFHSCKTYKSVEVPGPQTYMARIPRITYCLLSVDTLKSYKPAVRARPLVHCFGRRFLIMVDCAAVFTVQATLHEVELLSRRDYPMRVFISWEQASEREPLLACMEFQVY